MECFQ